MFVSSQLKKFVGFLKCDRNAGNTLDHELVLKEMYALYITIFSTWVVYIMIYDLALTVWVVSL